MSLQYRGNDMQPLGSIAVPVLSIVASLTAALTAGQQTDAASMVRSVCVHEVTADKHDHSRWMYRDAKKVPDKDSVILVVETSQGDLSKTIAINGRPLTPQEQKDDREKLHQFVTNTTEREKQKHDHLEDGEKAASLTGMLPDAFLWAVTAHNSTETTLSFRPNPQFEPSTREARVFAAMQGTMVVDNQQKRIKTLKGTLIQDVDFGFGLLGKLDKGGSFEIERQQVGPNSWEITKTHIHIQGHALVFKSIGEQQDEETSHYKPTPTGMTLLKAAKMLNDGDIAKALE